MKTNLRPNILWLTTLTLLTSCNFPHPGPPSMEEMQRHFVRCFREEMQPTDEQMKQLEQRVFKTDAAVRKLGDDLRKETDALESQLENPAAQDPELLERFHRVDAIRTRMTEDHFKRMLLLRSILTDEQKRKFLACKRKLGPPPGPPQG